ncbi:MAG: protein kinase, partial [Gemmatimonadetes bacterium]|nr:protein kinase [Gemmatimonadota bacterium]
GLSDIHAENIIHRDIKPNNIKLDSESIVKIYDLGFAREEGPKAKTKGFVGTVRFAAPELYGTDTVTFSKAIDVYAFGATAYFLSGDELPQELCKIPPNPLPAGSFQGMSVKIPAELASLFGQCLEHDPAARPEMADVRDKIARYLLQDKHQALTILNEKPSYLNAGRKSVRLEYSGVGKIQIAYDGLRFKVKSVQGEIYINNQGVVVGAVLPGSCVIAFGAAHRPPNQRGFVTFDISNPEVVV